MTTYQWNIQQLDCVPQENGNANVVVTAHWTVSATDGTYTSSVYGAKSFAYDAGKTFIPYANLTQSEVVGWVQAAMGIDAVTKLQQNLDNELATQANPPIITQPLPWEPVAAA